MLQISASCIFAGKSSIVTWVPFWQPLSSCDSPFLYCWELLTKMASCLLCHFKPDVYVNTFSSQSVYIFCHVWPIYPHLHPFLPVFLSFLSWQLNDRTIWIDMSKQKVTDKNRSEKVKIHRWRKHAKYFKNR